MYRRMVFVGLGGSGGKTLRFLKRDLRHWLTEHGWPEGRDIPAGFQFLHIDTPTVQDGRSMGGAEMLPDREYVGLVGPDVGFANVANQLDNKRGVKEEFAGWRVNPAMVNVPIATGAGAFRAIGRTIALAYMDQIHTSLSSLIDRSTSPDSIAELNELWALTHGGHYPGGNAPEPVVVVVSSLAGGTGAGLLLDVFDVLRSLRPTWGDKSFGILYTPEVFNAIGGRLMGGVQPNSLAAISELLNGYYWHGAQQGPMVERMNDIGFKEPAVLSNAGVIAALPRTGPAYPFLVGSRNAANISFNSDKKVFETIGGALLAWCIDEVVQDQLIAYTMTNWQDKSATNLSDNDLLINKGTPEEVALPAFSALGCARVSVGTRFLERYSAQRLARDAAAYIAGFHMDSEDAKQVVREHSTNLPAEISKHLAKRSFTWFVHQCELEEQGFEKNQILDAIRPEQVGILDSTARSQALSMVDIGKAPTERWVEAIVAAVRQATLQYQTDYRPHLDVKIKEWVDQIPGKVIRATEEAISLYGLSVTVDLLDELIKYLADPLSGVAAELMSEHEHGAFRHYASESEWSGQVRAILGATRGNFTLQTNEKIGEAIDGGLNYACYFAEAELREVVSPLLREFAEGFLRPLKSAIADAFVLLERQMGEVGTWASWSDGAPPSDVTPPDSEYTLIQPDQFSSVFLDMLARTVSNADIDIDARASHRATVRTEVISGGFLRKMEDYAKAHAADVRPAQAVRISQAWSPGMQFIRDNNRPRNNVQVDVSFGPEDLENRARLWLRRPNTAFNDLLKSTLRTYTASDAVFGSNINVSEVEYQDRRRQFLAQMQRAIQASAPLVALDSALLANVHDERPFRRQFSQLPFRGHPIETDVVNLIRPFVAAEGGEDDLIIQKYLVNDDSVESVQIISTLNGAHHPILFESLLNPIAQRWNAVRAERGQIAQFWSMRRARVLGEAIPAPQEHIIAMIRGWFTGRILGLIDVARGGESRPTRIAQPWTLDNSPAAFPYPFLTPPADGHAGDELFAVLESLSIAYIEVSQANNLLPLRPYIVMRDMGSMKDGSNRLLSYDRPNPLITSWITDGSISSRFTTETGDTRNKNDEAIRRGLSSEILPGLAQVSATDIATRKTAFLKIIDETIERYSLDSAQYWDQAERNRSSLNAPPYWPSIRTTSSDPDLVGRALKSLRIGVNEVSTGSSHGI
jgi:hypothetical protein